MIRKITTGFFLALILLTFSSGVSAQPAASPSPSLTPLSTIDVPLESVNPTDGISYLLKRMNEKVNLFFAFSNESKVIYYRKLVNVRLSELKFIIEKKNMGYFEKSTQRYFTTAGQLTSLLTSTNIKSEFASVREELSSHIPVLEKLRDNFDSSTAEWRFVEDDINYIKGYTSNLSAQ